MKVNSARKNKKSHFATFTITKRQKFVLVTILLTAGLLFTQLLNSDWRFLIVGILSLAAYFLSSWALKEDLSGIEWFTLLVLPLLYTLAVGLAYFLLPVRWITRLPVAVAYMVGMYALLLTENIYNVAAIRTIQLLRAAHAVGFLITLITAFLLFQTFLSFHLPFWVNFFGIFFITLPLVLQALWVITLEEGITQPVAIYSFFFSWVTGEIALAFSFWPVKTPILALFLVAVIYAFLGVGQQHLSGRLLRRAAIEFFLVPLFIFFILIFTAKWGG